MVKLVVFDLDGVLIDAKQIHFDALNDALREVGEEFVLSHKEHILNYDGLPTKTKLLKLALDKNLPQEKFNFIFEAKQYYTIERFKKNIQLDYNLLELFSFLKQENYIIAVASNSIGQTIEQALLSLNLINYVDFFLSNEDVDSPKPSPEIYLRCMIKAKTSPRETLIVEDSIVGRKAALASGGILCPVKSPKDVNISKLKEYLMVNDQNYKWHDDSLNVLIPMAGAGSRFQQAGYTFPKPLIEVNGDPMIKVVVDNINMEANHIFITQKEHYDKYNLKYLLNLISSKNNIIQIDGITEGAAVTTLKAKELINNDNPLVIANSDQFIEWSSSDFMYSMMEQQVDAGIVTFTASHPKWSFVKLDDEGFVTEVAEKKPISDIATVGVYFWRKGSDYVKYAEQMIANNIRTNNEFYVAPVFNEAIKDGKKIRIFHIDKMWGIGTPEDLDYFIENYKGDN